MNEPCQWSSSCNGDFASLPLLNTGHMFCPARGEWPSAFVRQRASQINERVLSKTVVSTHLEFRRTRPQAAKRKAQLCFGFNLSSVEDHVGYVGSTCSIMSIFHRGYVEHKLDDMEESESGHAATRLSSCRHHPQTTLIAFTTAVHQCGSY